MKEDIQDRMKKKIKDDFEDKLMKVPKNMNISVENLDPSKQGTPIKKNEEENKEEKEEEGEQEEEEQQKE